MKNQLIRYRHVVISLLTLVCTFCLPLTTCRAAPPTVTAESTPETTMRRYLECWLHGDSKGMWLYLSKNAKRELPLPKFQKNVANSDKNMVRLTRIISVRRMPENSSPTVVYVTYQVEAKISQKEADTLRKAGHPNAKPGLFVFNPTTRRMVLENGQWFYDAKARKS